jgi:hypothetical protein
MDVNTPVDNFDAVIASHGSGLLAKIWGWRQITTQTRRPRSRRMNSMKS